MEKEETTFFKDFDLREIFKDNHRTEKLYSISLCPNPRPHILAVTASNHLSVFDLVHCKQWLRLLSKFLNGTQPSTSDGTGSVPVPEEKELVSFSWLAPEPFRALAGTRGGEIKRFNLQKDTRELKPFVQKHAQPVTSIASFLDGKYAVSLSKNNGEIRVWDSFNPDTCLHMELIDNAKSLTASFDGQSVLIGCKNSLVSVTMQPEEAGDVAPRISKILDVKQGINGSLLTCKSLSSEEVVLVSIRKKVSVWNLKSQSRVSIWQSTNMTKTSASFDVCKTFGVCVLGCSACIEIRDVYSGFLHKRIVNSRIPSKIKFTHIGIAQDGQIIVAGSGALIYKFSNEYNRDARVEPLFRYK